MDYKSHFIQPPWVARNIKPTVQISVGFQCLSNQSFSLLRSWMSLAPQQNFPGSYFLQLVQTKQKDWQKEANVRECYGEFFGRSKKLYDFDK